MKKIITLAVSLLFCLSAFAQEENIYKASKFNIKSDGIHDNTTSIQGAIDWLAAQGGGTLEFSVGRYICGAVDLKSGVDIKFREGAVIVGSDNIYSYKGKKAIFNLEGVENVRLYGVGVFEGRGEALKASRADQIAKGYLTEDCPVPTLVYIKDCKNTSMENFVFRYPASEELYIVEGGDVKVEGCYTDVRK